MERTSTAAEWITGVPESGAAEDRHGVGAVELRTQGGVPGLSASSKQTQPLH